MKPTTQNYKLLQIKKLTYEVFELVFEAENEIKIIPGQFITFLIPKIGARAYSVLEKNKNKITFIIKKVPLEKAGRGGSKFLCEAEIGTELRGIGPSGAFTIKDFSKNKLFLGTGVGVVPLYSMIKDSLENNFLGEIKLIFGVKDFSSLFYFEELKKLREKYNNFSFEIYLSREKKEGFKNGYITKFIDKNTKNNFKEAYICGSPEMVDDAKEKLKKNGFDEGGIFEEKY